MPHKETIKEIKRSLYINKDYDFSHHPKIVSQDIPTARNILKLPNIPQHFKEYFSTHPILKIDLSKRDDLCNETYTRLLSTKCPIVIRNINKNKIKCQTLQKELDYLLIINNGFNTIENSTCTSCNINCPLNKNS